MKRVGTTILRAICALTPLLPADAPTEDDLAGRGTWNEMELKTRELREILKLEFSAVVGVE